MKKGVLYLLAGMYTLGIIKPTLPFVYDAVAHAFFYHHHVTTIHAINGEQHTHHEFVKEAKKQHTGKNDGLIKKLIPADDHFYQPLSYTISALVMPDKNYGVAIFRVVERPIKGNFPPPKLSAI